MNGLTATFDDPHDVHRALRDALDDIDNITTHGGQTSVHLRQLRSQLQAMRAEFSSVGDNLDGTINWRMLALTSLDSHARALKTLTESINGLTAHGSDTSDATRKQLIAATLAAEEARQDATSAQRDADLANELAANAQQCALMAEQHCNELQERLDRAAADTITAQHTGTVLLWKGLATGLLLGTLMGIGLAAWMG